MPFGLKNGPSTFQRPFNVILATMKWQFVLVYSDSIVIFFMSLDDHIEHVRRVLALLHDTVITLRLKKCKFFRETIDYLGRVIRPKRLMIASHATDAIRGI